MHILNLSLANKLRIMEKKKKVLTGLHSDEYEHPLDKEYLDIVENIPGLPLLSKKFIEWLPETIFRVQNTGSYLKITPKSMPEIYRCLEEATKILDLDETPDFFVKWEHSINAYTSGVEKPFIVLNSGCIDLLDRNELMFILGHELGHIKSGHVLYHQMADVFPALVEQAGQLTLGIAGIAGTGIQLALNNWYRMAEFTADRAGFLVCQDKEVGMKTLIKLSGLPASFDNKNLEKCFYEQAKEFEALDQETLSRTVKLLSTLNQSHPWTVMRGSEYLKWSESGKYDEILNIDRKFIFCSNCGQRNYLIDKFCSNCGTSID